MMKYDLKENISMTHLANANDKKKACEDNKGKDNSKN